VAVVLPISAAAQYASNSRFNSRTPSTWMVFGACDHIATPTPDFNFGRLRAAHVQELGPPRLGRPRSIATEPVYPAIAALAV